MNQSNQKIKPLFPSRLRGRGVEVSKTLFYDGVRYSFIKDNILYINIKKHIITKIHQNMSRHSKKRVLVYI